MLIDSTRICVLLIHVFYVPNSYYNIYEYIILFYSKLDGWVNKKVDIKENYFSFIQKDRPWEQCTFHWNGLISCNIKMSSNKINQVFFKNLRPVHLGVGGRIKMEAPVHPIFYILTVLHYVWRIKERGLNSGEVWRAEEEWSRLW